MQSYIVHLNSVMYVSRRKPRLKAEKVLPQQSPKPAAKLLAAGLMP